MTTKIVAIIVAIACIGVMVTAGLSQVSADVTSIVLSDSKITVDGKTASGDPTAAVYVGADIVYYEAGMGTSYGEGTSQDEHSAEEAAAHTVVTITKAGTYKISGTLSKGQIAVDLGSEAKDDPSAIVHLILDGVDITCTVAPAVIFYNVWESKSTAEAGAIVTIADGKTNTVNGAYVARIYKPGTISKLHKYDGAFYSKKSMIIQGGENGSGILIINAANEGLDSEYHLTINGGNIYISSQDDGINANEDYVSIITINGGYVWVNGGLGAEGDGIDSNGYLTINGGTLVSFANPRSGDGGIDADMEIVINGGTVIALGSRNDAVSSNSEQAYIELSYAATKSEGTLIRIVDENGNEVLNLEPLKNYQSFTFSSPDVKLDAVYNIYSGGTITGVAEKDGVYAKGGTFSGGTKQQYTGNASWGFPGGMMGMRLENMGFDNIAIPEGMTPSPQEGNIEQRSEAGRATPQDWLPDMNFGQRGNGGFGGGRGNMSAENAEASTEFILTDDIRSFSNITDDVTTTGKVAVTFQIESGRILDTQSGTAPNVIYMGAYAPDGTQIDVLAEDIQITITDVPSEDYAESCFLSDGQEGINRILPTDAGIYRLTIAIVDSNQNYTGSTQWQFTIAE